MTFDSKLRVEHGGAPAEDPLSFIRAKLNRYPQARATFSSDRVTVEPIDANGFAVTFIAQPATWTVHCEGWHEHFTDVTPALECFAFALSTEARLLVTLRGATPYRWQLQVRDHTEWRGLSEVGLFLFPFWKPRSVRFLQNRLLVAA